MRKWLIVPALAAALFGGWYYASPLYAMHSLREAALSGSSDALEAKVDFLALRDDLKQEVAASMAQEIASDPENPFGAVGSAIGMAMIGPMIDGFVTPEMIARLVREGKAGGLNAEVEQPEEAAPAPEWQINRSGLSGFTAHPVSSDGAVGPELEFARDGLAWKLVGIDLPQS